MTPWRGSQRLAALATATLVVLAASVAASPATEPIGPPITAGPNPMADELPLAALRAEPPLPTPAGWPLPDSFPRTSGTGRLAGGAMLWTDFLYDDHGATGVPVARPETPFAPTRGTYEYVDAGSARNGADIFRIGIGADEEATYWRVDWNTLVDPSIPMAVFAIDSDADPSTGSSTWPAAAGVESPGIDRAIVVSAGGSSLVDLLTGGQRPGPEPVVDIDARSFVLRLPRTHWELGGTSRIRLVTGIAGESGMELAPVPLDAGGRLGGPSVYNVGFRHHGQEPVRLPGEVGLAAYNYWNEAAQAAALTAGDISSFAVDIVWADLLAGTVTAEPQPRGWTTRWYVSSIEVGAGVVADAGTGQDLRPNFLGRVQPYGLYVPETYDADQPTALTWLLHSAYQPHNAFGAVTPRFVEAACERRRSLCATPLGRGHDGWYLDEAELDFWEVWGRIHETFHVDRDRTVLAGFSMGGYAVYRLGLQHPHLFARAVVIGASPICGRRVAAGIDRPEGPGICTTDGDTKPMLENGRWLPFYISHGTADELLPVSGTLDQVGELDRLGLRYRFEHYIGQPHVPWYLQDRWAPAAEWMGTAVRQSRPGRFSLRWYPNSARPEWGIGATGAYWVSGVQTRQVAPGVMAQVRAHSSALTDTSVVPVRTTSISSRADAGPAIVAELAWQETAVSARGPAIDLELTNVSALVVDLAAAGLRPGSAARIAIATDGHCNLGLTDVTGAVWLDGYRISPVRQGGVTTVVVPAGTHTIDIRPTGESGRSG